MGIGKSPLIIKILRIYKNEIINKYNLKKNKII